MIFHDRLAEIFFPCGNSVSRKRVLDGILYVVFSPFGASSEDTMPNYIEIYIPLFVKM